MDDKKYLNLSKLSLFFNKLKSIFATSDYVDQEINTLQTTALEYTDYKTVPLETKIKNVEDQVSNKADKDHLHDGEDVGGFTSNRVIVSNSGTKLSASNITTTELDYLDGVSSSIQEQLNNKSPLSHNHGTSSITSGIFPLTRGGTGASTSKSARSNLKAVSIICQATEPSSSEQNVGDFWFKEI